MLTEPVKILEAASLYFLFQISHYEQPIKLTNENDKSYEALNCYSNNFNLITNFSATYLIMLSED